MSVDVDPLNSPNARLGLGGVAPQPRRRDWVLAFVGALILSDAFDAPLYSLFGSHAPLLPGMPVARWPLLIVFVAAAFLLADHSRSAADQVRDAALLWPPLALAFLSAIWSEQPSTTLLWASALLGTSAFGVAISVRFSAAGQSSLIAAVCATIAAASILATLIWPGELIASTGSWRGVYVHKNLLGRVMALGVAAGFLGAVSERYKARFLAALFLCGGVLLRTKSRGAILAALVTVAATALLLAARRWRFHARVILTSGVVALLLAVVFLVATPQGLAFIRRGPTLSDRTIIWKVVAATALETPWLGHGYAAFWPSAAGQKSLARIHPNDPIDNAHNGALDLFAELGVVGLVLVLAPLGIYAVAALRHALDSGCLWPAVYVVLFVASNAAESAFFRHKLLWALYVAAACRVAGKRRSAPTT